MFDLKLNEVRFLAVLLFVLGVKLGSIEPLGFDDETNKFS